MIYLEHADFDVFSVPGLEGRMDVLIRQIRPKLHAIGELLAPEWASLTGQPAYVHVAKHARRSVNPPNDTWVAWASNKRGYKALPHLQFGLWGSHAFLQFAVIYECPGKAQIAEAFLRESDTLLASIPDRFGWSGDHMSPVTIPHTEMGPEAFGQLCRRLAGVKSAELMVGRYFPAEEALSMDRQTWENEIYRTLHILAPVQRLASASVL